LIELLRSQVLLINERHAAIAGVKYNSVYTIARKFQPQSYL